MNRLSVTRQTLAAAAVIGLVASSTLAHAQTPQANFTSYCAPCHTIGGGRRVGPDLAGVTDRRSEDWLIRWVTSSQAMVRSGDPDAIALFKEFSAVMPDSVLSPDQIRGVLDYIQAGGDPSAQPAAGAALAAATPDDVRRGRLLFQGGSRLVNGGPACASCHHVTHDNVVGGGVLAKELTTAFTRLGGAPGLQSILSAPPFPVMQQAYSDRPIAPEEVVALVGYLQEVSASPQSFDQPREDSIKLLGGGLVGLCVLMVLYAIIWRRRKRHPVNARVFDRQVCSK